MINAVVLLVIGFRYYPLIEPVRECSQKLMVAGMLFFGEVAFVTAVTIIGLLLNFVVPNPKKFWGIVGSLLFIQQLIACPVIAIWSLVVIASKEAR